MWGIHFTFLLTLCLFNCNGISAKDDKISSSAPQTEIKNVTNLTLAVISKTPVIANITISSVTSTTTTTLAPAIEKSAVEQEHNR